MILLGDRSPIWLPLGIVVILAVPQGPVRLANQNAVYHQAHPEKLGASAGLLRTFMCLGAMIAAAATGFSLGPKASTPVLHELALFMLTIAVAFLLISLADRALARVGRDHETTQEATSRPQP